MSTALIRTAAAEPGENKDNWLNNVMEAFVSGYTGTVTFWTDGWTIPEGVTDIKVYAGDELVLYGKFREQKKDTVYTVFKGYRDTNLMALGLGPNAKVLNDFLTGLNQKYPGANISGDHTITCIKFLPTGISDKWHAYLSEKKGSPVGIRTLSSREMDLAPAAPLEDNAPVIVD